MNKKQTKKQTKNWNKNEKGWAHFFFCSQSNDLFKGNDKLKQNHDGDKWKKKKETILKQKTTK